MRFQPSRPNCCASASPRKVRRPAVTACIQSARSEQNRHHARSTSQHAKPRMQKSIGRQSFASPRSSSCWQASLWQDPRGISQILCRRFGQCNALPRKCGPQQDLGRQSQAAWTVSLPPLPSIGLAAMLPANRLTNQHALLRHGLKLILEPAPTTSAEPSKRNGYAQMHVSRHVWAATRPGAIADASRSDNRCAATRPGARAAFSSSLEHVHE